MKRILALSLSAALLLALLCACGGSAGSETTVVPPDSAGESATVPPGDTTQEPSLALPGAEPSEEPSAAPGFGGVVVPGFGESAEPTAEPSQEPSQAPATQPPATQPPATQPPATQPPASSAPPPSESTPPVVPPIIGPGGLGGPGGPTGPGDGPSQGEDGDVLEPTDPTASNMVAFLESLKANENYAFPDSLNTVLYTDTINYFFPGLASIPAVQRVVFTPTIGYTTAEIALIQVTNSSDLTKAKEILENRIQRILIQEANYLTVVDLWTDNSRIVTCGDYIMLVVHSECDAIVNEFNAFFS